MAFTNSNRVTIEVAHTASKHISREVFKDRVNNQREALCHIVETLAKKCFDKDVLEFIRIHEGSFEQGIFTRRPDVLCKETNERAYPGVCIVIPLPKRTIEVTQKDFNLIQDSIKTVREVEREMDDYEARLCNTLIFLKTKKKIQEQMPEIAAIIFEGELQGDCGDANELNSLYKDICSKK